MRDIFVVAVNIQQFYALCTHAQQQWDYELKHRMVHFVHNARELACQPARVFLYGSFYRRRDWPQIELMIKLRGHRELRLR